MREKELFQQCLKIIRFFAQKRGTTDYEDNKVALTNELLKYLKYLIESKSKLVQKLSSDHVINSMRQFLIDPKSLIRQNAIKFLRYLVDSPQILEIYRQKHIPLFIARCLERDTRERGGGGDIKQGASSSTYIHEIIQSIKFIRKWIEISPKTFPKLLANSLVAFAESSEDQLKKAAIESLRQLVLGNPEICAWCSGIKFLIDAILDPSIAEISESITYTLLFLLNEPNYRNLIRSHLDFAKIFSIFTDVDLPIDAAKDKSKNNTPFLKFEAQLNLAKKAIIVILKSWTGLIYLGNEKTALKSIIMALKQPIKPIIRNAIYEIIGEILSIGLKQPFESCKAFRVQNLLNYYLVMLLQLFLDCGL